MSVTAAMLKDLSRSTLANDATQTTSNSSPRSIGGVSAFSSKSSSSASLANATASTSAVNLTSTHPEERSGGAPSSPIRTRFWSTAGALSDDARLPKQNGRPPVFKTNSKLVKYGLRGDTKRSGGSSSRSGGRSAGQSSKVWSPASERPRGRASLPGEGQARVGVTGTAKHSGLGGPNTGRRASAAPTVSLNVAIPISPLLPASASTSDTSSISTISNPYRRRPFSRQATIAASGSLPVDDEEGTNTAEEPTNDDAPYGGVVDAFYETMAGKKHHPYPKEIAPYWMAYGHETQMLNSLILAGTHGFWGTYAPPFLKDPPQRLTRPNRPDLPLPKRILDVGCGPTASWCVGLSREPGFEAAEFVGLDLCPNELDDELLVGVADRIVYVRHNFLMDKLPFEDNTFDYVHASFLSPAIPESSWDAVIGEMVRVARPGTPIEITEADLFLPRPPDLPSSSMVSDIFSVALKVRNVAANPMLIVSCALEARTKGSWSAVRPISYIPTRSPSQPELEAYAAAQMAQQTGPHVLPIGNGDLTFQESKTGIRVFAHAVAQALSANRELFWEDCCPEFVKVKDNGADLAEENGVSIASTLRRGSAATSASRKDVEAIARSEFDMAWDSWMADVESRADLAKVLEARWGWRCEADEQAKEVLEVNLEALENQLQWVEDELRSVLNAGDVPVGSKRSRGAWVDAEAERLAALKEKTKRQLAQAKVDLFAVQNRLGLVEEKIAATGDSAALAEGQSNINDSDEGTMGTFQFGTFIGYKADVQ